MSELRILDALVVITAVMAAVWLVCGVYEAVIIIRDKIRWRKRRRL